MATTSKSHEASVGSPGVGIPPTRRTHTRQSALLAWFIRVPVGLYRLGLADQLGRSTLLLTTGGRKTGAGAPLP
jgi:hypothetical protein